MNNGVIPSHPVDIHAWLDIHNLNILPEELQIWQGHVNSEGRSLFVDIYIEEYSQGV